MKLHSHGAIAWREDMLNNQMVAIPIVFSFEEARQIFLLSCKTISVLCVSTETRTIDFCTNAKAAFDFFSNKADG